MGGLVIVALIFIVLAIVIVLVLVYGLGFLIFAWWDGGLVLKVILGLSVLAVVYGIMTYFQEHSIKL